MHHLFIRDSEPPRTISRLLMAVLGMVVCLVVVDRVLGFVLPRLTIEPPFILRLQNVQGVERLWAMNAENIKPVVFTGSSMIHTGLSPHIFDDQVKAVSGKTVNSVDISVWGGVITSQREMIQNLIIPNHPQVIIYGIEMRALLPAAQEPDAEGMEDFHNKPLGYAVSRQSGIERDVLLWLMRYSNLFRYRDNIREWLTAKREINFLGYSPDAVDDRGHYRDVAIFPRDPVLIKGYFTPFSVSDDTRQTMSAIGATCKQSGVQCILLNMPIHETAFQYITGEDVALYNGVLREAGLPVWDFNTEQCRRLLGDQSYFDIIHLNEAGAEIFSKWVADVYAQVFFQQPLQGDVACAKLNS
ncbi:MAG: hypothetical protein GC179_22895 [Anaerolineaceae bacterium]|nr:hypothetical protein [Anaerolineaceae bacterium]